MFKLALMLGLVALVAAILGFGGLAGALVDVAIFIFAVALVLSVVFLLVGWSAARKGLR